MKKSIWRGLVEATFIVFLFYANLLMGEFTRSGMGRRRGLVWAMEDVLTPTNLVINAQSAAADAPLCIVSAP